ncbi:MAG TPA: hypothetical protein VMJ10_12585 [Kofleriaceae bacterium]|nr:hypothetical protein [Kofleriaceae bacterium]
MDAVDERLAQVSAVLVDERILRRVIKLHRHLRGVGLQVPHAEVYALPRADLAELVSQHELHVDLARLPDRVIALAGSREALAAERPDAELRAWRAIFHARVHEAFEHLLANGTLTPAAIRERIARIGQTEFDEIRFVLRQADLLLPPHGDTATYVEFVALYLELKQFAPDALAKTFPALHDATHVDAAIALDLDPRAILHAARPPGAPEAPPIAGAEPIAPSAAYPADAAAAAAATTLATRLATALGAAAPEPAWIAALEPLAARAACERPRRFTADVRMWRDLDAACEVFEREVRVVDVVGWALSLGRRPILRALPATREVRVAKHLRAAAGKLGAGVALAPADRDRLAALLHELVARAEDRVRGALRGELEAALDEVGLRPRDVPERVAKHKLVDELLDHAARVGHLSIGNLRDALSHNQLKMSDLQLAQLWRGDALLRCDRRLARSLDGVYRRGEVYLRVLQKLSSILFGTRIGRLLSLYLLLPVLGSFVAVEGVQHLIGPLADIAFGVEPRIASLPVFAAVAGFLFLLLHVPPFRHAIGYALRVLGRVIRFVLYDAPKALWNTRAVRRLRESRFGRLVLAPAIPAAIIAPIIGGRFGWPVAAAVFVVAEIVVNSRAGRRVEEIVADWLVRSGRHLVRRIVPGLVKYILQIFAELVELFDRSIYRVDDWLRAKSGQRTITLVLKAIVTPIWRFVTYFLRLYINLFVEPVVNPVKHFPVVTVAAKVMVPFDRPAFRAIHHALGGGALAGGAATFTVFVIPGLAGFLVWELKENWKLYAATRPARLRQVAIGHHGESMVGLMKPGFHSGTIPKLFGKLRRAAWKGDERAVGKHRAALHEVEEAIDRFADRELVALFREAPALRAFPLDVHDVAIASNRVAIALACSAYDDAPCVIAFEEQSGWLLANIRQVGWLARVPGTRRIAIENAFAGFYQLAGVDLVREQLAAVLAGCSYDVSREGLVAWPGAGYATEVVYDLHARDPMPVVRGPEPAAPLPELAGAHARFGREPIRWVDWVRASDREDPPRIATGPSLLPDLPGHR